MKKLVFIVGCMVCMVNNAIAQGTGIVVSNNTAMSVNSGVVSIAGNLNNNGTIDNSVNTNWVFTGGNQTINGSSETVFSNITFNLTAPLTINKNIKVKGLGNWQQGVVNITTANNMLFGTTASANSSNSSYAVGKVMKQGNSNFMFPYGYNGKSKKVRISNFNGADTNTVFMLQYHRSDAPNASAVGNGLYELNHVDYYDVTRTGNGFATFEIEVDPTDYPPSLTANTASLRFASYDGSEWQDKGGFNNTVFTYGVKSAGNLTQFTSFALASSARDVLALSYINIQAARQGNNSAHISWASLGTSGSVQSAVLQRSSATDGTWVDVHSILNNLLAGDYTDERLGRNIYLYRIKAIQSGGQTIFSNTASVKIDRSLAIKAYPTLTHADVNISSDISEPLKLVEVYAASGAKVATIAPSGNQYRFNMSSLAAGIYQLKIYTATGVDVVRIVKY